MSLKEQGKQYSAIHNYVSAIIAFYKINDIILNVTKISKAVFVSNQHRGEQYPASKEKRMHFAPNEIQYSEMKGICIIPSCVLFESVKKVLK